MYLICAGEAMAELRNTDEIHQVGFAGDTFNTAIYAKRALGPSAQVGFLTRIGTDPMSDGLSKLAAKEQIALTGCARDSDRNLGIYSVTTDETGERAFHYWRETSAARNLFTDPAQLHVFTQTKIAYLSGITLAILTAQALENLVESLAQYRKSGGQVAFDSNYRPRLWKNKSTAQSVISRMWQMTDIALPSVDDEMELFGDPDDQAVLTRLRQWGCQKGALKRGPEGPTPISQELAPLPEFRPATKVVDTTAAGDSFNGTYLAGVLRNSPENQCLIQAHNTAKYVVGHSGAIVPIQKDFS